MEKRKRRILKINKQNKSISLPSLHEVVYDHGLTVRKSLGQNFLLDGNILKKIVRTAGNVKDAVILEIGPGPGGLTRALLEAGAGKVVVIERDQRFSGALEEISGAFPGRLEIIEGDALNLDHGLLVKESVKIVANLPYNIATVLLISWLSVKEWPPWYQSMTLMFQKEVAQRICAAPGNRAYGRLSILTEWRCHRKIIFDVPPSAFSPQPKVFSSIVNLTPKPAPLPCRINRLEHVTKIAFGQRRKMLRASLKSIGGESLLKKANIDPTLRPEEVSPEEFIKLANLV